MTFDWPRALKRFFRSPATIVGDILLITVACALGATLPQAGNAPAAVVAGLRSHGALSTALVNGLALDHVFNSVGFLTLMAFSTASLSIVVIEQVGRFQAQWNHKPIEAHFQNAPFRTTFTRPATGSHPEPLTLRSRGRLGLAGSPLFHIGLLCVILAGALQALFGVSAVVDLYEGEILPPTVEAWGAQWPGPLGKSFCLDEPLLLTSVAGTHYPDGNLKSLRLKLVSKGAEQDQPQEMGVNEELSTRRGRLFLDRQHGPAALLEWEAPSQAPLRVASLLEKKEAHAYGAYTQGPGSLRARVRAPMSEGDQRPGAVEVRILNGAAILVEGTLRPGETLPIPGGGLLRLHSLPYWARLHGNHDPALGLAYLGFALALLGAALTYGVTKVDELVAITRDGEVEQVVVALRPHRFAPLFKERFEQLVREHGGEVCPCAPFSFP